MYSKSDQYIYSRRTVYFVSSMLGGFCTSAIFHPLDRGLYLATVNHRPFLALQNFVNPMQGFVANCTQKTCTNGLYFFMQSELRDFFNHYLPENMPYRQQAVQFATGFLAGSGAAILNNPFTSVRYYMWGKSHTCYVSTLKIMWEIGGYKVFLRGTSVSLIRDAIHGCVYEIVRSMLFRTALMQNVQNKFGVGYFVSNIFAASLALTITSPINYVRNILFQKCPSVSEVSIMGEIEHAWNTSASADNKNPLLKFNSLFKGGWGIARGAAGIVLAQQVADVTTSQFKK